MKKYIPILILALVIIAIAAGYGFNRSEDREPTIKVEDYVKDHISDLSPVGESLGGTFFVTDIEVQGGAGTVEYEDGHNAYVADFAYEVGESGEISVTSFEVRD